MVYAAVLMFVLMGVMSLGVDLGRVQCAKTELQNAADAAARYAATGLSDGTTLAKAQTAASENRADGSTVALLAADVETGTWNSSTKVFTVTGTSPDAVRVTARRVASRSTAVPLYFGRAIGQASVDVRGVSIARFTPSALSHQIVGIDGINMSGTSIIDADTGQSSVVTVTSNNGWWNMNSGTISGNVYYRNSAPTGNITGTKTLMPANVAYATPTTPGGCTPLGNVNSSTNQTLAGGNYSATSISLTGGTITINGDINIYCSGNFTISGNTLFNTLGTTRKVKIYITVASGFNYSSPNTLYAPACPANINDGVLIGSLVAKSLSVAGDARIRYNALLPIPPAYGGSGGGSGAGTIAMVD